MPRLFVAVWPPEDVLRELVAMPRPAVHGLRWTAPARLHVTLRFLGQCNESEVEAALSAADLPAARVTLGPRAERLGRGVLMIPVQGLDELAAAVTEATEHIGQPPPKRPFTGHMTVGRFKRDPSPGQWPPAGLPTLKAAFTASGVALVRVEPSGDYVTVDQITPS